MFLIEIIFNQNNQVADNHCLTQVDVAFNSMMFNLKLFYCFWLNFLAKFSIKDAFFDIVLSVRMLWNSLVSGAPPRTPPHTPPAHWSMCATRTCNFYATLHTRPRNRKSWLRTPPPRIFPQPMYDVNASYAKF